MRRYGTIHVCARLLATLAVLSLGLLGGTYSHATGAKHVHSATDAGDASDHSHIGSGKELGQQSANLHCGANILATPVASALKFEPWQALVPISICTDGVGKVLGFDPPPPR